MGARQHYVPRFLQKGFCSKTDGEKTWIWQVRRAGEPIEISTIASGVSKNFYGNDDEIENLLGSLEGETAAALKRITEGSDPQKDSALLSRFVWTQGIRTKAFRESLIDKLNGIVSHAFGAASQLKLAQNIQARAEADFVGLVSEQLSTLPLSERIVLEESIKIPELREIMKTAFSNQLAYGSVKSMFSRLISSVPFDDLIAKTGKHGQISGLGKVLKDRIVPAEMEEARWYVTQYPSQSLLLGDICVLFVDSAHNWGGVGRLGNNWQYLVMPFAGNLAIIAHREGEEKRFEANELNFYSASFSYDAIYCSTNDPKFVSLREYIGTIDPIMSKDELDKILDTNWFPQ
jgi:hypothetical protein